MLCLTVIVLIVLWDQRSGVITETILYLSLSMDNFIELPWVDKSIRYSFHYTEIPGVFRVYLPGGNYFCFKKMNGKWISQNDDPAPFHNLQDIGEAIHRKLGIE